MSSRVTIPTSSSPASTGSRRIRCWTISAAASSSAICGSPVTSGREAWSPTRSDSDRASASTRTVRSRSVIIAAGAPSGSRITTEPTFCSRMIRAISPASASPSHHGLRSGGMPERPEQTGPVAVYGVTGYTGRLVAEELERREAEFVLAGRDAGRLEALASTLGGEVRTASVSLDDPAGLRELLEPCAAVIACAGPFTRLGEPVVAAAADAGTHYLDTTGEQPFIRLVFDRYGERAADAGAVLVPAMGFDYAPGDLIAALTAAGMGPLDELALAYTVRGFGMSRGTMHSGLLVAAGGDVEYRDGAWREPVGSVDRGTWDFPPPVGEQRMIRYPGGEQITVPRHVEVGSVSTMF